MVTGSSVPSPGSAPERMAPMAHLLQGRGTHEGAGAAAELWPGVVAVVIEGVVIDEMPERIK
eukprot:5835153-Alexandrium_andersonii.AAC.1